MGFPFPRVSEEQVLALLDAMVDSLGGPSSWLLPANVNGEVAGRLFLAGNANELIVHCARVLRVQ